MESDSMQLLAHAALYLTSHIPQAWAGSERRICLGLSAFAHKLFKKKKISLRKMSFDTIPSYTWWNTYQTIYRFTFYGKKLTFTSSKSILCFTLIKLGAWQNHILKSREGPLSVTLLILSSKTQFNCFFKSRERESIEMCFFVVLFSFKRMK